MGRLLKTSSAPRRVFVTLASAGLTTLLASFSGIAEASGMLTECRVLKDEFGDERFVRGEAAAPPQ